MGWIVDLLKEIPLSAVLKEKIANIEAKYAATETENAILKDDLRKANAEVTKLKKQAEELSHKDDLDETELKLLHIIANLDYDDSVVTTLTPYFSDVSAPRLDYHIQRLEDFGYLHSGIIDARGIHYSITQEGRTFLLKKGRL
jgi:hypothetical protein